jgi:hypothetical protein
MTHRIPKFLLLVLLSLSLWGSSAQDAGDSWRIIVLDAGKLKAVTPDGIIATWELPLKAYEVAVSPTEDIAIISVYESSVPPPDGLLPEELLLFDLDTGVCCTPFITLEMFSDVLSEDQEGFWIGGFNDDGSLFAFGYTHSHTDKYGFSQSSSVLAVIDMATRQIIATKEIWDPFAGWIDGKIVTYPLVSAQPGATLEKYVESTLRSWDPFTLETTETNYRIAALPYYAPTDMGDFLVTGERIASLFMMIPDEPLNIPGDFPYVLYNTDTASYPIWFDLFTVVDDVFNRPHDLIARWISDGRYIYNRNGAYRPWDRTDQVQILSRNGEIETLQMPYFESFLTGTPDGWLALDLHSSPTILIYYTYAEGILERKEIATFDRESIKLLKKPRLGYSLENPTPFPEVQPPRFLG